MDPERSPYPVAQTQSSDIDPRLQEATQSSQTYSNPPPQDNNPTQFRLPIPPPQQQQQQTHPQPQYSAPPQWPQEGYDPYYGPQPSQQPPPIGQIPQHQVHGYNPYQNGSDAPPQPPDGSLSESKRPRACEACRGLKVRCEPDPGNGPCKRCAKANRNCVITPPSRKRQKKTDNRVAELERKIDQLRQEVNANKGVSEDEHYGDGDTSHLGLMDTTPQQQPSSYSTFDSSDRKRRRSEYPQDGYDNRDQAVALDMALPRFAPNVPNMIPQPRDPPQAAQMSAPAPAQSIAGPAYGDPDAVDRGLISSAMANELFSHYMQNMVPHMPVVTFLVNTNWESVRKTTPILFLAIMSVASGQGYPSVQVLLKEEVMSSLGKRIIVNGEKSIELVQALQVVTIWYWPESNGNSKYYQLIHIATIMAMDLGIDRKPRAPREQVFRLPSTDSSLNDTETAESRRAWLGCYLLSSSANFESPTYSIAMGKKRSSLVRPNAYMEDCITSLRLSQHSVESDTILVRWVRLQMLADELVAQVPPDAVNITEAKARSSYRTFEKQLKEWEDEDKSSVTESLTLSLAFNVVKLYMHELVILYEVRSDLMKTSRGRGKSQVQISSPNTAFVTTLGILDTFAKFNTKQIRTLPVFQFAQLSHATVSLMKLYFAAKSDPEVSKHVPITSERIETYTNHIINSLELAAADGKSLGAHTFLMVFVTIQKLFVEHKDDTLEQVKIRYGCMPGTKQVQVLDLEEPRPTAQRRAARRSGESSDEALHLLSEVAMGKSGNNGYTSNEAPMGQSTEQQSVSDDMATIGKLIGDGDLSSMSDDGFFGIMQTMWARST